MNKRTSSLNSDGFSIIELLLIIIVIVVIGAVGLYAYHHDKSKQTSQNKTVNIAQQGVTLQYVSMPGLSDYNAGKIGQLSNAQEAQGNYMYADSSQVCTGNAECGFSAPGKIVYDGKTVFSGTINNLSLALSSNGLKYTYNQVNSSGNDIVGGVSNSGTVAYSDDCSINIGKIVVYSSSTCAASSYNLSSVEFSSDLQSYIAGLESNTETPTEGTTTSVIYDGKTVSTDAVSADFDDNISENGQHYIYSSGTSVVVDGKTVATTNQSGSEQSVYSDTVTDQGRFAFTECNGTTGSVNIDGTTYQSGPCNVNNPPPIVALDNDNNNYFYFEGNEANDEGILNGKTVQLSGKIDNVQLDGNTLYVYRWVN